MAIAEQFAGLDMEKLIGAPLSAASDASMQLANSTAEFINRVGFDNTGKLRTAAFMYEKRSVNEDGTSNLDEMKVAVPMLAIIPIPNLQIDEVNVLFDMEVKQTEKQESSLDVGASLSGSVNIGYFKVSVSGSVSVHQANTRSSDNSAKYHVDVRATNHGVPEGLARVLDMMAANVAPSLVGSTIKDGNGQDLSAESKKRAENLKKINQDISQLNQKLSAAKDSLSSNIAQLKNAALSQNNIYHLTLSGGLDNNNSYNNLADEDKEKVSDQLNKAMIVVDDTWTMLQNQAGKTIELIASNTEDMSSLFDSNGTDAIVSDIWGLKEFNLPVDLNANDDTTKYYSEYENTNTPEIDYKRIAAAQNNAVEAQKLVINIEKEIADKKNEYSNVSNRTN